MRFSRKDRTFEVNKLSIICHLFLFLQGSNRLVGIVRDCLSPKLHCQQPYRLHCQQPYRISLPTYSFCNSNSLCQRKLRLDRDLDASLHELSVTHVNCNDIISISCRYSACAISWVSRLTTSPKASLDLQREEIKLF